MSCHWCDTADICMDEIERRSNEEVENGNFPTLIFISGDLYAELQKLMVSQTRYSSALPSASMNTIMSINVSAGSLNIQLVKRLRNFLMISRKEDFEAFIAAGVDPIFWDDQERARIDKAFEDLVILTGEENG